MPRVTILDTGNSVNGEQSAKEWVHNRKDLYVDTEGIRNLIGGGTDRLVLSIRDSIIIKAIRSKRNIIVGGNNNVLEQIERIAEVVEAQQQIDNGFVEDNPLEYTWKVKRF